MAQYHRLSLVEREELSRMLAAGASLRAIGQLIRAPSTLSRELARHHASPVTYRAVLAHQPRKPRKLAVQPRLTAPDGRPSLAAQQLAWEGVLF